MTNRFSTEDYLASTHSPAVRYCACRYHAVGSNQALVDSVFPGAGSRGGKTGRFHPESPDDGAENRSARRCPKLLHPRLQGAGMARIEDVGWACGRAQLWAGEDHGWLRLGCIVEYGLSRAHGAG